MVVVSVVISFMGLGYLQGVREGTIITALAAGTIVALIGKLLPISTASAPLKVTQLHHQRTHEQR